MTYVVNCRECNFIGINDTTFDTGNASLVADQHEFSTYDADTDTHHTVIWKVITDRKAEDRLEDMANYPPHREQ